MPSSRSATDDSARSSPRWEADALERSLRAGRARSVANARRLVGAARALAAEAGPAFTVQQVATRSGLSLKTLYKLFPSKDDLVLAVFEEDNRAGAAILARIVEAEGEPADRLRAYIRGLFEMATNNTRPDYTAMVLREYLRLASDRADDVERVLSPFLDLLIDELEAAAASGAVSVRDARHDAVSLFLLVVSHISPFLLSGDRHNSIAAADAVWRFCFEGLHPDGANSGRM
jgi:AcrR family transcriptional regulator